MKTSVTKVPLQEVQTDALVVGVCGQELQGVSEELNRLLGGALQQLSEQGEWKGKTGEVTTLLGIPGSPAPVVVLLGLGKRGELNPRTMRHAAATAALSLASRPRRHVEYRLDVDDVAMQQAAVIGAMTGCHGCDLYRAEPKLHPFEELSWAGLDAVDLDRAAATAGGVNLAKQLVNQPASHLFPESFADRAEQVAEQTGLTVEVWDQERLEKERCGALLAVARGSAKPPRLVMLRHQGGATDAPWLGLVGKGVTFDSGGLSLKPSESMKAMKCDMAGAATVLGAMQAIAQLHLPVNVIGLCGLVENMVNGDSYKLGDVLTARNGRTIEVLNTDAEGRLVLADTLDVAIEQGAARLVDLATLTGACLVALGAETAGLMTNTPDWCEAVSAAASHCGERVWQLPMFPEYGDMIRSQVADIKNIGEGRLGGSITAAKFLEEFVGDTPWTHIDIAGPAFMDSAKSWHPAGGTGAMVPTLVQLAATWEPPT